ncbi:MAG: alpha/beta fold hydrolase [Candidatus Omnitrophota bacterium]
MYSLKQDEKTGVNYRCWEAASTEAVLLFVHGLGAYSARWDFTGKFFLKQNISSYAIELKGFGEDKGLKGHIDSFNTYFNDIRSLINIIFNKHPNTKIFLMGESLGALISFMFSCKYAGIFNGLICISPSFLSRMKVSFLEYVRILFAAFFSPCKQFNMPFDSAMCTQDKEYQKIMDEDKREHRLATARLLMCTLSAQIRALVFKTQINIPVLFLLAGEDKLVDPRVSKKVFQRLKAEDKKMIEYPDMYHALSIELGREKVFQDIVLWLRGRIK